MIQSFSQQVFNDIVIFKKKKTIKGKRKSFFSCIYTSLKKYLFMGVCHVTGFIRQDQDEQAYFAVFDGHGGVDAAIYAANHLHVNLVRQESFSHDPSEALCRAFKLTDEGFVKKARREVNTAYSNVPEHHTQLRSSLYLGFMNICFKCIPSTCAVAQQAW